MTLELPPLQVFVFSTSESKRAHIESLGPSHQFYTTCL